MSALTNLFSSLANKIRTKLNTSQKYTPAQAIAAIDDVYTKGVSDTKVGTAGVGDVVSGKTFTNSTTVGAVGTFASQEKTVTAGTSAASVTPDSGKYLSKVTYNPTPSQTKSASPSTSAQTISPDSGKLLSSVSISAISPIKNNVGESAIGSGVDSTGPFVWIPYGWYAARSGGNPYIRMTAAQAVAACPSQTKSTTSSRSAQTISPDSGKLLSSVSIAKYPDASGTYTASSRGASLDMGATNNLRYVNTNSVPNSNSGTYTPTGADRNKATADMGASNTYRYVNTKTCYDYGYSDGYNAGHVTSLDIGSYGFYNGGAMIIPAAILNQYTNIRLLTSSETSMHIQGSVYTFCNTIVYNSSGVIVNQFTLTTSNTTTSSIGCDGSIMLVFDGGAGQIMVRLS